MSTERMNEALAYRTIGTLMERGVPILECLSIASRRHPEMSDALDPIHAGITTGSTMADNMAVAAFSSYVPRLVRVGEEIGGLGQMLIYASDLVVGETRRGTPNDAGLGEIIFYRSLGRMIWAGLQDSHCVTVLQEFDDFPSQTVLSAMGNYIGEGHTLHEAIANHRDYFGGFATAYLLASTPVPGSPAEPLQGPRLAEALIGVSDFLLGEREIKASLSD